MFSLQANSQYSPIHLFLTKYTSPPVTSRAPRNPQGTLTTWRILPLLFIFLFHTLQTSCFPVFRFGGGGY